MRRFIIVLSILPIFLFLWGGLSSFEVRASDGTVGMEICKGCHEDRFNTYMISTHSKKSHPRQPGQQGRLRVLPWSGSGPRGKER